MDTKPTKVHVLVFPYPAQTHMLPLLDLTHQLTTCGVSITILVTPKNLPILHPILSKNPSIKTLVLPFPPHPSIPAGFENLNDDLPLKHNLHVPPFISIMQALHDLYRPIADWFNSHPDPPAAIISDMFLGWTHHLADELGIKRIEFSPTGAFSLSVLYNLWRQMPNKDENGRVVSFPEIPNCPKYPWWQLSSLYRSYAAGGEPVSDFIKQVFRGNLESWGVVTNSLAGSEQVYLEFLRKDLGHNRVWGVGPLLPLDNDDPPNGSEIESWLDTKEDRTVVYVCFGSQAVLSHDQVRELASGLEKSGVHFILCVREPTCDGHVEGEDVPEGFEDRVAGRGRVIRGWAEQAVVLRHRAVGTYFTNCGWNSVLEGIMAGVVLLCWPMWADHYNNATLLVEELKVGITACEGARTVPDSNMLAQVVADSVNEKNIEMRKRLEALRETVLVAVKDGGSSVKELDRLVDHLVTLP